MQIYSKYEQDFLEACNLFKRERERLFKQLQTISYLKVFPSQANYFLCKVTEGTSTELTHKLLNEFNILIKDCSSKSGFNNRSYIRIAIRDREDNLKLIRALKAISSINLETYEYERAYF
jgi:histidinol-phosphate/aromatic aminotransferase/cobyric acid decarboxylase-like protein